jgi:hypothetical protein
VCSILQGVDQEAGGYSATILMKNQQGLPPIYLKGCGIKNLILVRVAFDDRVFYSALDVVNEGFEVMIPLQLTRSIGTNPKR